MPILPGSTTNSLTVQQLITEMRVYPDFVPVLGTSGYTQYPALTIANEVMQRVMSEGMDWKWNRKYVPSILTVALQQDYPTQITDIGWLEGATCVDINNSTNNTNRAPKPEFSMLAVRDLDRVSVQGIPQSISFLPNRLATMGTWQANTAYSCSYGVAQTPLSPIQQFVDVNGNILYIDSTSLNLTINSQGYAGTPITLPSNSPYGVSGGTPPSLPAYAPAGSTVQDGTVTWTVADPEGFAMRLSTLPAFSGVPWLIQPIYQSAPPTLTDLKDTVSPLPSDMNYLFRQGFRAMLYEHAGSNKAQEAYAKWEEALNIAVRSADRQQESYSMIPEQGLTGRSSLSPQQIGAGWPFGRLPWQ